jgi:hypothetical protein
MKTFQIGDSVVYRKEKISSHPGPRATAIYPSRGGETYTYLVPKFWRISELPDPDHVVAITRTGKRHHLSVSDSHLRKASLIDRIRYRNRFPQDPESDNAGV